jgi:hypothetical protein
MEEETYLKLSTDDKNFSLDVLKTLIEEDIPFSYSNNTIVVNKTNLSEEQREAIEKQRPKKVRQLKSLCKECSVVKGESELTEQDKSYVERIIQERVGLRPLPPSKPKLPLPSSPKRPLPSSPRRLPMPSRSSRIVNIKNLEEK